MKAFPFSSIISVVLSPALVMAPLWAQTPSNPVHTSAEPDTLQIRILNADGQQPVVHPGTKQSLRVEVTDSAGAAVSNAAVTCRLPDSGPSGTFADGSHAAVAYTDSQGRATIDGIQWGDVLGSIAIRLTATKGTIHTGILVERNLAAAPVSSQSDQTVVTVPYPAPTQPSTPPTVISEPAVSVTKPADKSSQQPGQLAVQTAAINPSAINPAPNKLTPETVDPTVSVTRTSAADAPHSSHAKWYILLAIIAAGGAGAAFAMKGKGSSSSTSNNSSSLSIGNPTVSVGQP